MTETSQRPYLSIIIPAYNEGKHKAPDLINNLRKIGEYLGNLPWSYEVIVVNDGSQDDTLEIVRAAVAYLPSLTIINRAENRGKWYSLREGYLKARGRFCLFSDADGATAIDNLERFRPFMHDGCQVVIGSRTHREAQITKRQPRWREVLGKGGNLAIRSLAGLRVKDTQCGFKLLSAQAVRDIIPLMTVDRWGGDFELLILAQYLGYQITEVPVVWHDAGKSLLGPWGYLQTLRELLQVKGRLLTGKYQSRGPKQDAGQD
jgi:dolichyl-phosphate beta-glucosyltransferase